MRTRQALLRTLALSLIFALLFPFSPLSGTARAADQTAYIGGMTVSEAIGEIDSKITDASGSGTVTVTGTVASGSGYLTVHIPTGVTVVWKAQMTGAAVELNGSGTFEVAAGGQIHNPAGNVLAGSILFSGDIKITGGSVSSGTSTAIRANNVTVSGGSVSSSTGTAILMNSGTVNVSGGSVSSGIGTAIAVSVSGNVNVSGGSVSSGSNTVIMSVSGNVNVSGGAVLSYSGSSDLDALITDGSSAPKGLASLLGDGMLIAWDATAGRTDYEAGTDTDITFAPAEGSALWAHRNGQSGIAFAYGSNSGFIPLPVSVPAPDPVVDDGGSGISGGLTGTTGGYADSGSGGSSLPLRLYGLPGEVRVGESFTLTPSADGRTGRAGWTWDESFFDATFNSPATFTALQAGETAISFTAADGRSATVNVTVLAAEAAETQAGASQAQTGNPRTGGGLLPISILSAFLLLAAPIAFIPMLRRRQR